MPITWEHVRRGINKIARERSEWAGIPMVVHGMNLKLEPRFPYQLHIAWTKNVDEGYVSRPEDDYEQVNTFWSVIKGARVTIIRKPDGHVTFGITPPGKLGMQLRTLGAAVDAFELHTEFIAMGKLASMISDRMFKAYCLTGVFLETSKRSGVTYMFRRLRPTVAFKDERILCTLCLHPIGFYKGTYSGAMVPTDDVMAHLCMMRGDEPKFWANANQHAAYEPESAL